jgi:3-hydroxyisobutyrate dehydrogenase
MHCGFIGLGHLGKTIARRLITEGVDLSVWNRTRDRASDLGVPVAANPADLMFRVEVVFLNLFDSPAVQEVLSGPQGLFFGDCHGKIIVDLSTNHFDTVLGFHSMVRDYGATYLECPVLGSVIPASQGALTLLVSGDAIAYAKVRPLLEKIGKVIFYLGEPSLATRMKLVNNLVLGSFMATIAEAVVMGEKAGIPREKVIEILLSGAGNSMVLAAKREKLLKEDFSTHFSSALIYKDLHYIQDLAMAVKQPLFMAGITKELFGMTYLRGIEGEDFSAVFKVIRES